MNLHDEELFPRPPLRFGVIGTGCIGREHLSNLMLHPHARVVAFADPCEASRKAALELLGGPTQADALASHTELLARSDVDIVIVATPNHTHIDVLRDAVPTGKHILCEKPLCTTVEDCWEVLELHERQPKERRGLLWVGMEYRYMAPLVRMADELRGGTTGPVRMLTLREHRFPFLAKVGGWNRVNAHTGGTLVEKACHFFDLMIHLVNLAPGKASTSAGRILPVGVYASGGQSVNHLDEADVLDNAYVVVDFSSGARACLELCMFAVASEHQFEVSVVGGSGKVEAFMPGHGEKHLDASEPNVFIGRRAEALKTWNEARPPPPELTKGRVEHVAAHPDPRIVAAGDHHGSTYVELDWMVKSVRAGAKRPHVSIADSILAIAVGVAAHRSISLQQRVRLDEVVDMARVEALLNEHDLDVGDAD